MLTRNRKKTAKENGGQRACCLVAAGAFTPIDPLACRSKPGAEGKTPSGFTLIELLVVVAIISLLVSILLPSLKTAKELAKTAICAANLRNINAILHSYATESDGEGPAYRFDGSDCPSSGWSQANDWTLTLFGGNEADGEYVPGYTRTEIPGRRKLREYGQGELFLCPADVGSPDQPSGYNTYRWTGCSYFYNSNWYGASHMAWQNTLGGPPWVLFGRPFEDFEDATRQVMTSEPTLLYTWPYWTSMGQGPHGLHVAWHDPPYKHPDSIPESTVYFYDPKCNVGFLDAHVEFLKLGPYEPGDYSMNRGSYVLDPRYPG